MVCVGVRVSEPDVRLVYLLIVQLNVGQLLSKPVGRWCGRAA